MSQIIDFNFKYTGVYSKIYNSPNIVNYFLEVLTMDRITRTLLVITLIVIGLGSGYAKSDEEIIIVDKEQNLNEIIPFKASHRVLKDDIPDSPLTLSEKDLFWEFDKNGEYIDLVIRKKKKIGSVMITNMYFGEKYIEDYGKRAYGLRARGYNIVNGNEVRVVNNKIIGKKQSLYFLVDSTPEKHPIFGFAFRIRIPRLVEYGYKSAGENYGIISIDPGVTLNLRAYIKKYADHRGGFQNNPVHIDFTKESYANKIKPDLKKVKEYDDGDYRVVKVEFTSQLDYVSYFLVRDIHKGKAFKRISFVAKKDIGHETAVVIRAIRKPNKGISVFALVYLKKGSSEKDYHIAAIDQSNRISKNYLNVTVEQLGSKKLKNLKNKSKKNEPREKIYFDETTLEENDKTDGDEEFFDGK